MSKIDLLNTSEYSKCKKVSRVTVWRRVRDGILDCYYISGSKRKWFVKKEPKIFETEQKFLDELLTVETV